MINITFMSRATSGEGEGKGMGLWKGTEGFMYCVFNYR